MDPSDSAPSGRPTGAALRDWALPILATLVLAAALSWDAGLSYQRRLSQEYLFLESHARIADTQLSGALRAIELALEDIGQRRRAAPQRESLERTLAGYADRFPELRLVFVTDASGRVTAASDPQLADHDASLREYFTHHRDAAGQGGLFISQPHVSVQGTRVIAVSHPLTDAQGRFAGIVGASLEPKYFESVLDAVRPETTGFALLVNTQGEILYAKPDAGLAGRSLKGGLAFEQHMAAGARSTRHRGMTKIGQVERVSVARRIDDTGLIAIVSRDYDEAMATWRRGNFHRGLIFAAAAAALFYLGWRGRRRQVKLATAQEDLLRLIVESPLPMMVAEGPGYNVILLNRRFTELTGYESGDIPDVGHWYRLAYPDAAYRHSIRQAWLAHYAKAQGTDAPPPFEAAIRCKNGEERTFDCYLTRFSDRAVVVFVDLTERRRLESTLRESEAQLRKAQEITHVGSWWLDLGSNRLLWSDEAYRIFDVAPGTPLTYELFLARIHPEDRDAVQQAWIAALGGARYDIEHRIVARGETRWVRERAELVFDREGRALSAIGTTHDITELKQAGQKILHLNESLEQRVRERTAELENSNRELESFSYSVSHDLRAPLRAIDGFSHVLAEDHGEALGEAGRAHLQRIRRAAQKMGTLIDNLLDLAQVSRQQLDPRPTDLSRIAEETALELAEAEPQRKVTWRIEPGVMAHGDPVLLKVALDNLLRNAWKFTAHAADARIEFGGAPEGGKTAYFVRDNGAGMDMAYAGKLFQPFQRLHDPKEFEGTGIGLAIVHRVIRRHGGDIRVESRPGEGTTFTFSLG